MFVLCFWLSSFYSPQTWVGGSWTKVWESSDLCSLSKVDIAPFLLQLLLILVCLTQTHNNISILQPSCLLKVPSLLGLPSHDVLSGHSLPSVFCLCVCFASYPICPELPVYLNNPFVHIHFSLSLCYQTKLFFCFLTLGLRQPFPLKSCPWNSMRPRILDSSSFFLLPEDRPSISIALFQLWLWQQAVLSWNNVYFAWWFFQPEPSHVCPLCSKFNFQKHLPTEDKDYQIKR